MKTCSLSKRSNQYLLRCPECGNTSWFLEVMAEEVHVVDGNLRYIRLLHAVVDHYICPECDEAIEMDEPIVK